MHVQPDPVGAYLAFSGYYTTMAFLFPDRSPLAPTVQQLDTLLVHAHALAHILV